MTMEFLRKTLRIGSEAAILAALLGSAGVPFAAADNKKPAAPKSAPAPKPAAKPAEAQAGHRMELAPEQRVRTARLPMAHTPRPRATDPLPTAVARIPRPPPHARPPRHTRPPPEAACTGALKGERACSTETPASAALQSMAVLRRVGSMSTSPEVAAQSAPAPAAG